MKILRSLSGGIGLLVLVVAGFAAALIDPDSRERLQDWYNSKAPAWLTANINRGPENVQTKDQMLKFQQQTAAGNQLIHQARLQLERLPTAITGQILQIVQTPDKIYRGTGSFTQAFNGKSRWETKLQIEGVSGHQLQISNGQVIWMIDHQQSKSAAADTTETLAIHRVDVQRISQSAQIAGQNLNDPVIARELQGGLVGLLAQLEADFHFVLIKQARLNDERCHVLEGRWKRSPRDLNYENEFIAEVVRQNSPEKIRLYLRERDLLPLRYLCLKPNDDQSRWYTTLGLEFTDIKAVNAVDGTLFQYRPSADQVPNDITHEALQRIEESLLRNVAETPDDIIINETEVIQ